MSADFSRIITLLRKEKGISQKQAAKDLEISQALLSHYEKGIRECGLAFVIRAADYYHVSCDFLLGRSPEREGTTITIEQMSDSSEKKELPSPRTLQAIYNKRLLFSSLNILFDLIGKSGNKTLLKEVSSFLTLSVYRMFRIVFRASKKNNEEMFIVPACLANQRAQADMVLHEAAATAICDGSLPKTFPPVQELDALLINMQTLDSNYPEDKSALLNLIKNCETQLSKTEK